MISDCELSELINVPKVWRIGDEKIYWPKAHEKFNLEWLETLWKYLSENCQNDLTMMENLNIIFTTTTTTATTNNTTNKSRASNNKKESTSVVDSKNIVLYKLSKNSNLVYTPPFESTTTTDSNKSSDKLSEETYGLLIRILNKLGFQCIDAISSAILTHPLFSNYVPNIRKSRFNLLKAFRNKYKHASILKITQDFNALLNESDIKLLQVYLAKLESAASKSPSPAATAAAANSSSETTPTATKTTTSQTEDDELQLLEILKELPIFENSAIECSDRYLPLKEASFIYDTPIKLPFELPGVKPFIIVHDNDT